MKFRPAAEWGATQAHTQPVITSDTELPILKTGSDKIIY